MHVVLTMEYFVNGFYNLCMDVLKYKDPNLLLVYIL